MAAETVAAYQWLYNTLTGDATLAAAIGNRVYDLAPQPATYPLIQLAEAGSNDKQFVNASRIWVESDWLIKVIDGPNVGWERAGSIFDRLDSVLQGNDGGTVAYGRVYVSVRQATFQYPEVEDGVVYRHLGGRFRLMVQDT